nr:unnamed protein product [Digitaria exilis]
MVGSTVFSTTATHFFNAHARPARARGPAAIGPDSRAALAARLVFLGSARSVIGSTRVFGSTRSVGRNLGLGRQFGPSAPRATSRLDLSRRFNPTYKTDRDAGNPKTLGHLFPPPLERRRLLCAGVPRRLRRRAMVVTMAGAFFFSSPTLFFPTAVKRELCRGTPRRRARSPRGERAARTGVPVARRFYVRAQRPASRHRGASVLDGSLDAMARSSVMLCARAATVGVEEEAVARRSRSRRPSGRHRLCPGTAVKGVVELPASVALTL